jgi:hypothetical protein
LLFTGLYLFALPRQTPSASELVPSFGESLLDFIA